MLYHLILLSETGATACDQPIPAMSKKAVASLAMVVCILLKSSKLWKLLCVSLFKTKIDMSDLIFQMQFTVNIQKRQTTVNVQKLQDHYLC